ncbi:MAG TPA: malate synthase A [Thermoplasmata archaeon]
MRPEPEGGSIKATTAGGVDVRGPVEGRVQDILTPEALEFLAILHRTFNPTRRRLLEERVKRWEDLRRGGTLDFLPGTVSVRKGDWRVASIPEDLQDRRVEITGPVERKMMINALNSGAKVFMADFEDSLSPTWANVATGHVNLVDAVRRTIAYDAPDGRTYRLKDRIATLLVRPRGWHLEEKHVIVDGHPVCASLADFGLYIFHNAKELVARGTGPYFYLAKLESHLEARLWNDVFLRSEEALGLPRGTIKATVLIETIPAAFEMDEILYELREHTVGLNAGRWDYMFSIIKKFRDRKEFVLPDRVQVAMTVPFMRAYTELLVRTCHRRGAHAIGGMAAFIPSRKDSKVNEVAIAKVREDKVREANDGFDGTWVAHPDLVPVATEVFDGVLGTKPNQVSRLREEVSVTAKDLLDVRVPGGTITEAGLRNDVSVGLQYVESWLRGNGAAAIFNLMEDTATAEIARSQVWQWIRDRVPLKEGAIITPALVRKFEDEELAKIRDAIGSEAFQKGRFDEAREIFEKVALGADFVVFLTLIAYDYLD